VLIEYLPEQMSAEEINLHIKSVIEQTGASSIGERIAVRCSCPLARPSQTPGTRVRSSWIC
ncbi:MAG: GatB/YqeY domain-containing protein, partial [Desulfobulbaceae bacterium]|nr:GatB/YqeY domain-containing protein [Desulfobulbaceae bacterium]